MPINPFDQDTAEELVRQLIIRIGDDPDREGLWETPQRVIKSFGELFAGYNANVPELLKTFSEDSSDEMVLLRRCEFFSTCEHHLQPFFGMAHVAYIPDRKVVGISKLARLVEAFSRRLQIQERLTSQIAEALQSHLRPKGVGVMLEARHFCMVCRGVNKQNSEMVTSHLTGAFKAQPDTRAEFFSLIRG
jgi:GTP cyclohydrolase I